MTSATGASRPAHRQPRWIALAFLGGAVGTSVRAGIGLLDPAHAGVPWATLGINVLGALVLAFLLESLVLTGPDAGWRKALRIGVGTGVLGGFTTYSSMATDTVVLLASARPGLALAYALGTVVLGALASCAGILAARSAWRRRSALGPEEAP